MMLTKVFYGRTAITAPSQLLVLPHSTQQMIESGHEEEAHIISEWLVKTFSRKTLSIVSKHLEFVTR